MTTGILLVDDGNFVADLEGNIVSGPESDKEWLRGQIKDKVVLVGKNTWDKDISKYPKLIKLATQWLVLTSSSADLGMPDIMAIPSLEDYEWDICVGGPRTIQLASPDRVILHRTKDTLLEGISISLSDQYKLVSTIQKDDYQEEVYEK